MYQKANDACCEWITPEIPQIAPKPSLSRLYNTPSQQFALPPKSGANFQLRNCVLSHATADDNINLSGGELTISPDATATTQPVPQPEKHWCRAPEQSSKFSLLDMVILIIIGLIVASSCEYYSQCSSQDDINSIFGEPIDFSLFARAGGCGGGECDSQYVSYD